MTPKPNFKPVAVQTIHPNIQYTETPSEGKTKAWDIDNVVIELDDSAIATEVTRLEAEWDAQEYAHNRKEEYDLLNQFEMQFDDELNDTTTWKDAINAIKAKYPKP